MVFITVEREEIVEMLARNAREFGLGLREFYELGKSDGLREAELRDLWLIWGGCLWEEDLRDEE